LRSKDFKGFDIDKVLLHEDCDLVTTLKVFRIPCNYAESFSIITSYADRFLVGAQPEVICNLPEFEHLERNAYLSSLWT
jgi:hypothetical protein